MDFSANIGTPVYATGDGTVVKAGWETGYGNLIQVDHGFGYVTWYAHLSKYKVRPGQKGGTWGSDRGGRKYGQEHRDRTCTMRCT